MMSQERYANPAVNNRINVSPMGMQRLDHGPDITVLENSTFALCSFSGRQRPPWLAPSRRPE
jgi:hypothetical protein